MTFSNTLKSFVEKLIDGGEYLIRDNELVFVIDPNSDDRYIYSAGKKWRVIIPHADDPKKKISVGYFDSKSQARHQRDAYLRREMSSKGEKIFKLAQKGFNTDGSKHKTSGPKTESQNQNSELDFLKDRYSPIRSNPRVNDS